MPQAVPASQSHVRMHDTRKNSTGEHSHEYHRAGSSHDLPQKQFTTYKAKMTSRTPMQDIYEKQTRQDFGRQGSPSKPSQEHTTAQPAKKTIQQVLGAHYTAKAEMIAAARAAAIAAARSTTTDAGSAQAASTAPTCSLISPATPTLSRQKIIEMENNDTWWQNLSINDKAQYMTIRRKNNQNFEKVKNKAQYMNIRRKNDPDRSPVETSEIKIFHDSFNSKQVLMDTNGELSILLNDSNYQSKNIQPFNSENPAFKSSFVIYGQKRRIYFCKACNHESKVLSNFKTHHQTRKHQDRLDAWNQWKSIIQDQPQSKREETIILNEQTYNAPTK